MKRINYILALLICSISLIEAQDINHAKSADPIVWFGFDFTMAKFVQITESAQQVKDALEPINTLVSAEAKKYDLNKFFNKQTVLTDLSIVQKRNQAIDAATLLSLEPVKQEQSEIEKIVAAYAGASDKADVGLVFVVGNCDKVTLQASVCVCFFDIATGKIIHMARTQGKPRGFGLRNYWAGAMYQIMKDWKY